MRYTNAERKQDVPMQREAVIFDFELVSKGGYPAYASYIDGMRTKAGLDNFLRGGFKRGQSDVPKDSILDSKDVVIFRGGVSEDGSFKGKLPPGKWRVMRLGYTSTNVHIHPATKGGFGLEVDKFSAGALERHFNSYPAKMISAAESNAGKVFKYIETDSWECGTQTWTESFDEHFKKMHGYDMLKYVPVFAGECIARKIPTRFCRICASYIQSLSTTISTASLASSFDQKGCCTRQSRAALSLCRMSIPPTASPTSPKTKYGRTNAK